MQPAFFRISPVNVYGKGANRLMIVLTTRGCEYAHNNDGGCTVCGFMNHAREDITDGEIVGQLDFAVDNLDLDGVKEVDLLTLGSFLNDREVSPETRTHLLGKLADMPEVEVVSIESRAEYVSVEKLNRVRELLGGKMVDFGIGLESADDHVRNKIINKGLSKKAFERVVKQVKEAGCSLLVYLLIKPPSLSETEAIEDAVKSVDYVFETARRFDVRARVAFEPVFICENTYLETLFRDAKYRLVNLWSVVQIVKRVHGQGTVFIGLSDENLSRDRLPSSCDKCNGSIIRALEHYNFSQDISGLEALDCDCKGEYEKSLIGVGS